MLKIVSRAIFQCVAFVVLLPVKILVLLWLIFATIYYKAIGLFDVRESLSYVWEGAKEQLHKEIHWVKFGEII